MGKYYMMQGGKRLGPLTPEELVQAGMTRGSMVWQEGMDQYVPANAIQELREVEGGLPPDLQGVETPGALPSSQPTPETEVSRRRYSPESLKLPNLIWSGVGLLFIDVFILFQEWNESFEWRRHGLSGMWKFLTFIAMVTFGVNLWLLLFRSWSQLQEHGARTTPGKAAWLCIVPFFNLYWLFVAIGGLVKDQKSYVRDFSLSAPVVLRGAENTRQSITMRRSGHAPLGSSS